MFGRSFLSVRPRSANWYVKSITYRGQDLADSPFDFGDTETFRDVEIVISGAGAMVTGRVTDDRAAPVRDYTVALFPTDRMQMDDPIALVESRLVPVQDGAFRVTGLVPGDYWVVAVNRLDGSEVAGDLQNPEVLDALTSRAQRITLGEGQSQDSDAPARPSLTCPSPPRLQATCGRTEPGPLRFPPRSSLHRACALARWRSMATTSTG